MWRTSSYSGGTNCVEMMWVKSSRSATNGSCVEVRSDPAGMLVRDSKDRTGPVLLFGVESWLEFIDSVKVGEFDR
jgi:hypothetical protein